ncbi:transporter substrate-binding domain-containing protein [Hoeflea sp. YIM 152468]|uniref:transporter substrate-binding domain-containing protein n=1 Tax=Hoeflea sp. YIM 152468 TaxID=3031759 RepID=UPI0023DC0D04|nr:transporter substrate-binding domain-containing protein [Hoeflea sp. YIM 152468]MDF1608773.1 transporter substrate-binding domain-containing protein [Hoeflea sp. YIM 152468]
MPNYTDPRERIPVPDLSTYNRIRFVTTVDFPPFNFLDQTGRLAGFHIDLARAICDELEILPRCQIQALPWAELEGALSTGQAEALIAGLAITADSRAAHHFTRTYLALPARFAIRADKLPTQNSAKALAGQRVGVLAGTAHEAMVRDWFGGVKPVTFSRPGWMFDALKAGSIDAVFGNGLQLSFWLSSQSAEGCCRFFDGPYFSQAHLGEGLAIAVSPRRAALAEAFDHALAELNRNGRFSELYLRWFPNGLY